MSEIKSGAIIVNKEAGWTSFDVCGKLRGILGTKSVGHTGTLDPNATGVLVVLFGRATKAASLFTERTIKRYTGEMIFGKVTDTQDITGKVLEERPVSVTREALEKVCGDFIGDREQIPPMYSAKKVNGKKLYEYAREGRVVERKPEKISIADIEIRNFSGDRAVIAVTCTAGTYIRTLINDMGEQLSCGACMGALRRDAVGWASIEDAHTIGEIETLAASGRLSDIITPIDMLFSYKPAFVVAASFEKAAVNGARLPISCLRQRPLTEAEKAERADLDLPEEEGDKSDYLTDPDAPSVRIYLEDGRFVGLFRTDGNELAVTKMFFEQ